MVDALHREPAPIVVPTICIQCWIIFWNTCANCGPVSGHNYAAVEAAPIPEPADVFS